MLYSQRQICLDASVVLAAVLPREPQHNLAVALLKKLASQKATLCAPVLFIHECDSVIRLRLYKGDLSSSEAQEARAAIVVMAVCVEFNIQESERAFQIACDYNQPRAYDAAYAAYAESRGVELVTADRPFFEAVNGGKRPRTRSPLSFVKLLS
jgi:predicted nucleic acid-binding protein